MMDKNVQASEPVYAYRRKGLDYFCTCDTERYAELSQKPNLFEVTVFYTTPQPAPCPRCEERETRRRNNPQVVTLDDALDEVVALQARCAELEKYSKNQADEVAAGVKLAAALQAKLTAAEQQIDSDKLLLDEAENRFISINERLQMDINDGERPDQWSMEAIVTDNNKLLTKLKNRVGA